MINFRFHLVSLVAVFLALALGVVMGYGVLGQPTVEGLQNRIDTVEANAEARRRENDELRAELERANQALDEGAPFSVTERLFGVPTVVLALRDVDSTLASSTVELARRGGADAPGILWLEPKWALRDDGDDEDLADALGVPVSSREELRETGYRQLVARLATGPTGETDVLRVLADAGFVSFEGVGDDGSTDLRDLGGPGARVIFADGTGASELPRNTAEPLARAAVESRLALVVAEAHRDDAGVDRGAMLAPIRDDEQLAAAISTVDDLDLPEGRTAAVLALADLARNRVGHFGFGESATRVLPEWWQP